MTLRIAWFASARGTGSRGLFNTVRAAIAEGRLDAEIVCVVCNREHGQSANTDAFLDDVERDRIPLIARSSGEWRRAVGGAISDPAAALAPWRRDFDAYLYERLAAFRPDLAMMAGYMLVVTDVICDQLACLNLHPALPDGPIGAWRQVIQALIAERADRSGMMLQRVTPELDRGPTATWAQYAIRGPQFDPLWRRYGGEIKADTPLVQAIRAAGVRREPIFILQSLRALAAGRAAIPASQAATPGVEITAIVEAELRGASG